jgi:hypothetical protein
MDDTHTADNDGETLQDDGGRVDRIDDLAALDPADAPRVAEEIAADLAAELEEAGAPASKPVQLRADLGEATDSTKPAES